MRIGPEPTTDNFHVIEHAEEDGKIPGDMREKTRDEITNSDLSVFHRKCSIRGFKQAFPSSAAVWRDLP